MSTPIFYSPFVSTSVTVDSQLNSLQGIKKNTFSPNSYLLTGTTGSAIAPPGYGALYIGAIDGETGSTGSGSGTWYNFSVPSTWNPQETSCYGSDILTSGSGPDGIGDVALAGTWINSSGTLLGWYYKGDITALNADTSGSISAGFQSFQATKKDNSLANYTYLHSVDGGLVVGNYTTSGGPLAFAINAGAESGSFIYNPTTDTQINLQYSDNAKFHTAFGIWENENNSYTISGGSSYNQITSIIAPIIISKNTNTKEAITKALPEAALGRGMLADVDPITGITSNLRTYNYNNKNSTFSGGITHFQGIYYMGDDVYQAPFVAVDISGGIHTGNAYIHRLDNGKFSKKAIWQTFEPASNGSALISTSVAGDADTGVFNTGSPFASIGSNDAYFLAAQKLK